MPTGTPKLERLKAAVSTNFPDAIYGQFNCKRRNGFNWSQHAGSEPEWGYRGNAVDIVHRDHGYGDTTPAHQAWLDQVNAFLVANYDALDLNELIWRKRRHFDHIHTSPWPKLHDAGLYRPPCKGGDLIVRFKDGSRGNTFNVLLPPPPPPSMEAANMAYADTLNLNDWVSSIRTEDIDQAFDLGIHGPGGEGSDPAGRKYWKELRERHPHPADAESWENYRRTTSARSPFWQPA